MAGGRMTINRSLIAICHDALMAGLSFVISVMLRLGSEDMAQAVPYLLPGALFFTLISVSVFVSMRLYRGIWRFASMEDLIAITRAVTLAILIFAAAMFFVSRLEGLPRSVLAINWLLLIAMLGAPRFAYRMIKDRGMRFALKREAHTIPLLLMGGGANAEQFVRENLRDNEATYHVVGIMDDTPGRKDRTLHGVRIYGSSDILPVILRKLERQGKKPQRLIITEETPAEVLEKWVKIADEFGLTLSRLPKLSEFRQGAADGRSLKPIAIEDLLGRSQATRVSSVIQPFIEGKRVLVTGAGGSIGSELVRQLATYDPASLILYEQSEYALYEIDRELSLHAGNIQRAAILGDVRNGAQLGQAFRQYQPEIVFHAAAIKHVPLSEQNPLEAIGTNVGGTRAMMDACRAHGVKTMVLISTDKAVNPTNVMGATKRLAEQCCMGVSHGNTQCITVRFGNVLGSAGSVVPLFQKQLAAGGPLTVTHPDMVRYFMTIREAVDLVLQAATLGSGSGNSTLFVLDMGKPVKIVDMARQIVRLSGLRPDEDIAIEFTGLRPGEKLFEELFYDFEAPVQTSISGVLQAHIAPYTRTKFEQSLETLRQYCKERRTGEALALLRELVPEFHSLNRDQGSALPESCPPPES